MLPILQAEPTLYDGGGKTTSTASPRPVTLPSRLKSEPDVDDLVDLFFEVDIYRRHLKIESGDLQPEDTWRGMQSKMSVTAPAKKIRKKSDPKPQSQINKCNNEKRRRELENETINQLEELLGTCLAEVKQPDKNGIVREATRKIQEALRLHRECPHECPVRRAPSASPVQAGEVSSTQQVPTSSVKFTDITEFIGTLTNYTSALGWVLLEINNKGEIECVTDNIKDLIFYDRTDLYKKPIFSVLHISDHSKIKSVLRKIQSFGWSAADGEKFQVINARLLTKGSAATDNTGYAEVLIHAAPVQGSSPEEAGSVMCVIRRCDDASAALLPVDGGPPAIPPAHKQPGQIIFRLDCNYTILSCDLSGIDSGISLSSTLVGTRILDLVEPSDQHRFDAHLREVVCPPAPPAVSDPFRLRVASEKPWIRLRAQSRLFRANPTSGEVDFIMSTHTVLTDEDVNILESNTNQPPIGGPLMTSVANGESSTSGSRYPAASPAEHSQFLIDLDLDTWGQAFQFSDMSEDCKDRKDILSEGPLTPRTPQTPSDNTPGPPVEEPNRLRTLLSKKPNSSNATQHTDNATATAKNRILKDLLKQEDEEATSSETSAPHTPHTPLTPHTPHTPHTPAGAAAALSPLHSSQAHARPPPPSQQHQPASVQQPHHNNSDMLLRILNDKSDDDNEERRSSDSNRSVSQPSALLTQLLSSSNGPSSNGRSQDSNDSYLERLERKRKFEEPKGQPQNIKRERSTPEIQQVSSSAISVASSSTQSSTSTAPSTTSAGMSPLCQKNQILVSLLARQQPHPTTPLPLPNPILRPLVPRQRAPQPPPTKHHHSPLSNMLGAHVRPSNVNGGTGVPAGVGGAGVAMEAGSGAAQSHLQMVLQGSPRAYPSPATPHYANTAPHHPYAKPPMPTGTRPSIGSAGGNGDNDARNDQTLSDLLDEVIENMPDSDRSGNDIGSLMGMDANRQLRTDFMGSKEENAMINAIRQSLMQCEKDTKNSVSPNPSAPPVYSVHSPGSCNMGSGLYSMGVSRSTDSPAMTAPGGGGGNAPGGAEGARALVIAEQVTQRARLLQLQRSQQMLVSPEAAEQPQSDLGSTINALVSATPPNVSLTRTDYHHLYHPASQIGSTYGTNKIAAPQQNPMLSRQLSGGYSSVSSGGAGAGVSAVGGGMQHGPAALHTPLTPHPTHPPHPPHQPLLNYHRELRAPRPTMSGYYEEGGGGGGAGGYCAEYTRRVPMPHHDVSALSCGGSAAVSGPAGGAGSPLRASSEFVRNELRAVVGARSRSELHAPMQQPDLESLAMGYDIATTEYYGGGIGGGGLGGGGR